MMETKYDRLLLIGPTVGSVHVENYYNLIKDNFSEVLIIGNKKVDYVNSYEVNFSLKNPIKLRKSISKVRKIIENFKPTVIHVHQANSVAYIALKANRGKIPVVVTCWGSDVLLTPHKGVIYKKVAQYALSKANYLTVDADYMDEAIKKFGVKTKVLNANFGIHYDDIQIPEKKQIVYSNRLHKPLYNIDKIIIGFKDFHKEHPNWKLVIGANGSETDKLKQLAQETLAEDSYEFIGFVSHEINRDRYLESQIYVSIPQSDGTAISLLEAMGYGCIPVVSNLQANKEWIQSGTNGIIAEDPLAESLKKGLELNLKSVQDSNIEIIKKKATKEVNREKFMSVYKELLND
jgi:glycosyltransferase involved in cell wall biosynthesis